MTQELLQESERKMGNSIQHLAVELSKLRAGRASLAILDGIKINNYGTPSPLNQAATLSVQDSQTIAIQPWDPSMIKEIEKAISASDLGLTPSNDGKVVRLTLPLLTSERRQDLVKIVKKYAEDGKVAIRNVRREFNDKIKALEKNHSISKDEGRKSHTSMQEITDKNIAEVDRLAKSKEKDILEV